MPARRHAGRPPSWRIALWGTRDERLDVARDPAASPEDLSAVAPTYRDGNPDLELITLVLAHPRVPAGVVSRYTRISSSALRLTVATHPACPSAALEVLAHDPDPQVAAAAAGRLRGPVEPGGPHGPVSVRD